MADFLRNRLPQESEHDAHLRACLERQLDKERQQLKSSVVKRSLNRMDAFYHFAALLFILRLARPAVFQLSGTEITALLTIFTLVIGSSVRSIQAGLEET